MSASRFWTITDSEITIRKPINGGGGGKTKGGNKGGGGGRGGKGGPGRGGGGGGDGTLFTLTVAASTVDADLTDYVLRTDLSNMPAEFWSQVHPSGANVRVYSDAAATVELPFHIAHLDTSTETGWLNVKRNLATAAATVTYVKITSDTARPAKNATNGSQAVYSAFLAASVSGWRPFNEVDGNGLSSSPTGDVDSFVFTGGFTDLQDYGLAIERTANGLWLGVSNTSEILLSEDDDTFRANLTSASLFASILSASGVTVTSAFSVTYNPGDGFYYGVADNGASTSSALFKLAVDDTTPTYSITFVDAWDISEATGRMLDICARRNGDGTTSLWTSVFLAAGSNELREFSSTTGAKLSTLTLDASLINMRGIAWVEPAQCWYVSRMPDADEVDIHAIDVDGKVTGIVSNRGASNYRNMTWSDNKLWGMTNSLGNGVRTHYTVRTEALMAGAGFNNDDVGFIYAGGLTPAVSYTMLGSINPDNLPGGPVFSYHRTASGATDRGGRLFISTEPLLGLHDTVTGDPLKDTTPLVGTSYRMGGSIESGVSRKFYVNGALALSSAIAAQPADLDRFIIGAEDNTANAFDGAMGQAFLAPSVLPAEFIKADYDNLNAPGTFVVAAAA